MGAGGAVVALAGPEAVALEDEEEAELGAPDEDDWDVPFAAAPAEPEEADERVVAPSSESPPEQPARASAARRARARRASRGMALTSRRR